MFFIQVSQINFVSVYLNSLISIFKPAETCIEPRRQGNGSCIRKTSIGQSREAGISYDSGRKSSDWFSHYVMKRRGKKSESKRKKWSKSSYLMHACFLLLGARNSKLCDAIHIYPYDLIIITTRSKLSVITRPFLSTYLKLMANRLANRVT